MTSSAAWVLPAQTTETGTDCPRKLSSSGYSRTLASFGGGGLLSPVDHPWSPHQVAEGPVCIEQELGARPCVCLPTTDQGQGELLIHTGEAGSHGHALCSHSRENNHSQRGPGEKQQGQRRKGAGASICNPHITCLLF